MSDERTQDEADVVEENVTEVTVIEVGMIGKPPKAPRRPGDI